MSRSVSPNQHHALNHGPHSNQHDSAGIVLPHASMSMMNLVSEISPDMSFHNGSDSPDIGLSKSSGADPFMDLLFLGWNTDLPDPTTLNHLFVVTSYIALRMLTVY